MHVAHDVNCPQYTGVYVGPEEYPPSSKQAAGSNANNKASPARFTS